MAVITPTITTNDPHEYREQMELIASYADGVHVDFSDGEFAPSKLLPLDQAWRHDDLITHIHMMVDDPLSMLKDIEDFGADLVILHAESQNLKQVLEALVENGTRTGIAMLPDTTVSELQDLEVDDLFEHILVFGGKLGSQGGEADLSLLERVEKLKELYPDVEISWDGGVNDKNAKKLVKAGVDILNVGGFLHRSKDPESAYVKLSKTV